jgi:uncharacterized membrane protein YGL010W
VPWQLSRLRDIGRGLLWRPTRQIRSLAGALRPAVFRCIAWPFGLKLPRRIPKGRAMKKSADQWFAEYGECHHNTLNEVIHWICIPAITLSLLGLLWSVPMPAALGGAALYVNLASLFVVAAMLFYLRLSPPLAIGMFVLAALFFALIVGFSKLAWWPVWAVALGIFVVAWILQFVGHKLEGKKPAFFEDIQFLLIGPIWLLGFIYRRLGIPY